MNMKQTINETQFVDAFATSAEHRHQFSYSALHALFNYYQSIEDGCGQEIEFDMIAICCEWTEYGSAYEAMEQYQSEDMPVEGEEGDDLVQIAEKNEAEALRWLDERTQVIEFDDNTVDGRGIIVAEF